MNILAGVAVPAVVRFSNRDQLQNSMFRQTSFWEAFIIWTGIFFKALSLPHGEFFVSFHLVLVLSGLSKRLQMYLRRVKEQTSCGLFLFSVPQQK